MAQALVITSTNGLLNWSDNVSAKPGRINLAWKAATDGTVSYALAAKYSTDNPAHARGVVKLKGNIVKIVTNPGATAPTASYDIYLYDKDGIDICSGNLADRSATITEQYIPDPPIWVDGEITLSIANAGDSKIGEIEIYIQG
jgi:hypothetical protein